MASVEVEGRQLDIYIHQVDFSYLSTMNIPIVRGRDLAPGDTRDILVSESMARRRWPNEDALGKPFWTGSVDEYGKAIDFTVVGVAGSARSLALKDPEAVERPSIRRSRRAFSFGRRSSAIGAKASYGLKEVSLHGAVQLSSEVLVALRGDEGYESFRNLMRRCRSGCAKHRTHQAIEVVGRAAIRSASSAVLMMDSSEEG